MSSEGIIAVFKAFRKNPSIVGFSNLGAIHLSNDLKSNIALLLGENWISEKKCPNCEVAYNYFFLHIVLIIN